MPPEPPVVKRPDKETEEVDEANHRLKVHDEKEQEIPRELGKSADDAFRRLYGVAFLVRNQLCRPEIDSDCARSATTDRLDCDECNFLASGFVGVEVPIVLEMVLAHYFKGQRFGHVIVPFVALGCITMTHSVIVGGPGDLFHGH